MDIPHFDLGGSGYPLHFLHANGYQPDCYKPLLELMQTEYHVFGMLLRALWDNANPQDIQDWTPFSDDLLMLLASTSPHNNRSAPLTSSQSSFGSAKHQPDPVIGVGHSIGATVTLRAALRDPGKFRALILLDPVLLIPGRMILWNMIRATGLADRFHPLILGAKKRRRTFDDLDTVYQRYRSRSVFKYISDEKLRIYIEGITRKTDNGYELVFSTDWEAQIYRTSLHDFDIWRDLPKLEVPTLFIRGAETDTFLEETAKLVKQKQPKVRIEALPKSTHLLPLERPQEVFEIMQSFLKEVL